MLSIVGEQEVNYLEESCGIFKRVKFSITYIKQNNAANGSFSVLYSQRLWQLPIINLNVVPLLAITSCACIVGSQTSEKHLYSCTNLIGNKSLVS